MAGSMDDGRRAGIAVIALGAAAVTAPVLVGHLRGSATRPGAADGAPRVIATHTIDINSAGADELAALPEVGPAMARAIVEDRERRGPFGSVGELERVRGIGPATVRALAPFARAPERRD